MMAILRCVHCGLEGDGVHGNPHKSTCKSTGKDDTYVEVGKTTKVVITPKPEPIVTKTTSTSPTKKKNKGRK